MGNVSSRKDSTDIGDKKDSGELHRSFGNKAFDLVIWPLVMGVGVWCLSYLVAKEGTRGTNPHFKWLRSGTEKFTNWFEKVIEKPVNTPTVQKIWKSSPRKWAESWAMWGLVAIPGTLLTPVMQYLEHNRKPISDHIDRAFHKTPTDPSQIKPEPKQTFSSMIAGRGVVAAGAAATMLAFGPKGMDAAGKWVGGATTDLYKHLRPGADTLRLEKFRANSDIAVFDMILTLGATAVMYGWSRRVARKHDEALLRKDEALLRKDEALLRKLEAEKKPDTSPANTSDKSTPDEPKAVTQDNTPSFTARAGGRPADFRALAQKESPDSGIAIH